jgi:fumarylacetoacetase
MSTGINETHEPNLRSWVESANVPGADYPVQNLPFGVFRRAGTGDPPAVGVAIGDQILDIAACGRAGLFEGDASRAAEACAGRSLNALAALPAQRVSALRKKVSELLVEDASGEDGTRKRVEGHLAAMADIEMHMPVEIGDYTDFYASIYHATSVGSMFRPDNPLLANYKHVPIAYHGRASSILVSGSEIRRPVGQTKADDAENPLFGPSRLLDYELEVGMVVGAGNALGEPLTMEEAEGHIFGVCIVNDWSARDIQKWEYQPLGPFLAKSFSTTISPWLVTMEALAPFRIPPSRRPDGDPHPMPYLDSKENRERGGLDLVLDVFLSTRKMLDEGIEPFRVSRGNFKDMYWTMAQMLTHHTSNGCNMRTGDLLASGTVSGNSDDSRGCLLEMTWRGERPLMLATGEERRFLQDGDEVIMRGYCEREGYVRIGLGECRGRITSNG